MINFVQCALIETYKIGLELQHNYRKTSLNIAVKTSCHLAM